MSAEYVMTAETDRVLSCSMLVQEIMTDPVLADVSPCTYSLALKTENHQQQSMRQ